MCFLDEGRKYPNSPFSRWSCRKKICADVPSILRTVWNVLQRNNYRKESRSVYVNYVERISLAFRHVADSYIVCFLWDLQGVDLQPISCKCERI